jgi:LPS-assembly lipoprotein
LSFRSVLIVLLCLAVSACGFRPLYGDFQKGSPGGKFLEIEVDSTKDREGQILRSELIRQLHQGHAVGRPVYRLVTELTESKSSLAVRKSAFATRANLTMIGNFRLYTLKDSFLAYSSTSRVTVSFNILDSEFASLLAEKNARERAVRELSQDIRLRLGSYFDREAAEGR